MTTSQIPPDPALPRPQPPGSKAVLLESTDMLTLSLPTVGFRGLGRLLVLFALPFLAAGFGLLTLTILGVPDKHGRPIPPLMGIVMFVAFGGGGVWMLVGGINSMFRKAVFVSDGVNLVFSQKGPFGQKQRTWPNDAIADVRMGPSGTEINNRPVMQLQIRFKNSGKHVGMLTGRDENEILWIASVLRRNIIAPATIPASLAPNT